MKRILLVLFVLLMAISTASAKVITVVTLKDGRVFEGTKIEENSQIIRLEFANRDIRVFYKSDIASISTFEVITPEEQLIAEYIAAQAEEAAKAEKQIEQDKLKEERLQARLELRGEWKKYSGYRQFVDLSYSYCGVTDFLGVNYIGGYRFNPYIFLGLGTGINIALFTPDASKLDLSFCKPSVVNIPVYIHLKTNFTKTNWSPYISLSAGGRISKKISQDTWVDTTQGARDGILHYNQSGILGELIFGIDRVISKKLSLYFGVGYRIESYLYCKFESNDELIQGHKLLHGFSAHLGLSF